MKGSIMNLYAIKIRKTDLKLITLLNSGVTPKIEKKTTYFVFDAMWNTNVPNQIVTEQELFNWNIKGIQPTLLAMPVKYRPRLSFRRNP